MMSTHETDNATDRLTEDLRAAILAGEHPPGARLPSEREMAERFGVNRVTVRGALARLESSRLVEIRPGSGCVVRDFRRSGGLDLALALALAEASTGGVDEAVTIAEDLLELRRTLAQAILRRLARKADPLAIARITEAVDAMNALVTSGQTGAAIAEADLEVSRTLVEATGSVVFQLCLNPITDLVKSLPGLADAIYAEPHQNVLSYRLLLGWLPLNRPEMIAPIMQALEAHDRAAIDALRRRRRRAE